MSAIIPRNLVIQGKTARLWRGGSGDPLVLIHGGLGDAELHWGANFAALGQRYDLIAPDLPGFGGTESIPQPSFQAYLSWLNLLFESERLLDRLQLVGNSFGGALARLYAAAHPDEVTRLVLVNGGMVPDVPGCFHPLFRLPFLSDFAFEQLRRRVYSLDGMKRLIHNQSLLTPDLLARSQAVSHSFVAAMRQTAMTTPPTLRTPTCPTLVVWGEEDRFARPESGRALAESIPSARFHPIKKAGHLPQLEQTDHFNDLVLKFLADPAV